MQVLFIVMIASFVCGCADGDTTEENAWAHSAEDPTEHWDKDCSGMLWSNGCDDCNPCTWAMWCDPAEWTSGYVPEACASVAASGVAQCSPQFGWTTPDGQINDCFPIVPVTDVRAGKCCAGTCIDNAEACVEPTPVER